MPKRTPPPKSTDPRETSRIGPRQLKDPKSPEFAWQTLSLLKTVYGGHRNTLERFEKIMAEAEQHRIYDRIPEAKPYGSMDAMLRAELGVESLGAAATTPLESLWVAWSRASNEDRFTFIDEVSRRSLAGPDPVKEIPDAVRELFPDINMLMYHHQDCKYLGRAVGAVPGDIRTLNSVFKRVVKEGYWKLRFCPDRVEMFDYRAKSFADFIRDLWPRGMEADVETLRVLLDAEGVALLERELGKEASCSTPN